MTEERLDMLEKFAAIVVSLAALLALLSMCGCRVGNGTLIPSVGVGYDPQSGNEVLSVSTTYALDLRHDRDQWAQAFGRRTGDIETIARLRQEATAAGVARLQAEEAARTTQAELTALVESRDHWKAQAEESDIRWFAGQVFSTDWNGQKLIAFGILVLLVGLFLWRKSKSGGADV